MLHELKTWPVMFDAVKSGKKRFELRKDDRDFQAGDHLRLMECDTGMRYSGQSILVKVQYILRDAEAFGLMPGFCAMSIKLERE